MKRAVSRAYRWEYFWLCLIVMVTLALHFAILYNPSEIIFDEAHYIKDARSITENHTTERPEHPPLGKLIITAGMNIFGDNPLGWRFFSIMFGTTGIVLFYFLCRRLGMGRTGSSLATFLLAFENMNFVMDQLAMLDVFFVTFMFAAFLLYVSRRYITSGISLGLSALAKLEGALGGPVMALHWIFTRKGRSWWFGLTALFAIVSFVELMIPLDYLITRHFSSLADPIHRIQTMLSLSGSLTFHNLEPGTGSHPWSWLLSYKPMAYWIMPHYTGAISFTVWALAFPAFGYMVYKAIRGSEAGLFGAAWFAGTYLLVIPLDIITDRVTYIFYFYPTIGSICIGLALALHDLLGVYRWRWRGKLKWTALSIFILVLVLHALSFVILSPLVPVDFARLVGITG